MFSTNMLKRHFKNCSEATSLSTYIWGEFSTTCLLKLIGYFKDFIKNKQLAYIYNGIGCVYNGLTCYEKPFETQAVVSF